jgi:alpha/beta superfamily hydrolase
MVLRFNFRGVGHSGGLYDHGRGEQADVAGAVDWLLGQSWVDPWRLYVVGYSFGAWVGMSHTTDDPRVTAVAAVGLAAWHFDADLGLASARSGFGDEADQFDAAFLQSLARPKLFVAAEHDAFAPVQSLRRLVERIPPPKALHVMAGTDHFFHGREAEVGELVAGFITGL